MIYLTCQQDPKLCKQFSSYHGQGGGEGNKGILFPHLLESLNFIMFMDTGDTRELERRHEQEVKPMLSLSCMTPLTYILNHSTAKEGNNCSSLERGIVICGWGLIIVFKRSQAGLRVASLPMAYTLLFWGPILISGQTSFADFATNAKLE